MSPADGRTMNLFYRNSLIKNTGGVMVFQMFGIEDSTTQHAYYVGLLGKTTISFTIKCESYFDYKTSIENCMWSINDKCLLTKLITEYVDSYDSYTQYIIFEW